MLIFETSLSDALILMVSESVYTCLVNFVSSKDRKKFMKKCCNNKYHYIIISLVMTKNSKMLNYHVTLTFSFISHSLSLLFDIAIIDQFPLSVHTYMPH